MIDSDIKWFIIGMVFFVGFTFVGMAFKDYHARKCRVAYVHSTKTAEEIEKICK
jgi:hypothetical protein